MKTDRRTKSVVPGGGASIAFIAVLFVARQLSAQESVSENYEPRPPTATDRVPEQSSVGRSAESETKQETEIEAETATPAETGTPAETEAQAETDAQTETAASPETATPVDTVTPPKTETKVETAASPETATQKETDEPPAVVDPKGSDTQKTPIDESGGLSIPGLILTGLGVAGIVTGVILFVMAASRSAELSDAEPGTYWTDEIQDDYDNITSFRIGGGVATQVGAVLSGIGVVLLLNTPSEKPEEEISRVEISPVGIRAILKWNL